MEAAQPLAELLHAWRDFYALVGAASATLVGLLFVAASIGSNTFREEHRAPLGSFLTPTVAHFTAVLLACMLGCIPSQSWLSFGGALGAGALAGLCYSGRILFLLVVRRRFKVDLSDQLFYAAVPALGYLLLLIAAALTLARSAAGVEVAAAALLTLLAGGVRNAWDMTLWVATKSPPGDRPAS
jgi:hypothetical protein